MWYAGAALLTSLGIYTANNNYNNMRAAQLARYNQDLAHDLAMAAVIAQQQRIKAEKVAAAPVVAASASAGGSPGEPPEEKNKGSSGGSGAGKNFTKKVKRQIDEKNAAKNNGKNRCEDCGVEVVPGKQSKEGIRPPKNERQRDHIQPKSRGGNNTLENGQILCRSCNLQKSNK